VVNENLACMAPTQVASDTTTSGGIIESTLELL